MNNKQEAPEGFPLKTSHAVRWYLRWLLLREIEPLGMLTQAEFARALGVKDSMVSQLKSEARGGGQAMLDRFAVYYRKSQGEIVEEARKWFAMPKWQQWIREETGRMAQQKLHRLEGRAKERRTTSSERPSVKALLSGPRKEVDEK